MKVKEWEKVAMSKMTLCQFWNSRTGMMGYLASFHSFSMASTQATTPKTIRQMTVGDDQG